MADDEAAPDGVGAAIDVERVVALVAERHPRGARRVVPERVVAEAADRGVVAAARLDRVVAAIAEHDIAAGAVVDRIVGVARIVSADDRLPGAAGLVDRIGAVAAEQHHRPGRTADAVVLGSSVQRAGVARLQQHAVIAAVTGKGGETGSHRDGVVASQTSDGARTRVAGLIQRVISPVPVTVYAIATSSPG